MKHKLYILTFFGITGALGLSLILMPDKDISARERRRLSSFPNLSDSQFANKLEDWALDQLPERNFFLDLHSLAQRYLFLKSDDGGIVSYDNYLIALEREKDGSLDYAVSVFDKIYEKYLKGSSCSIYLSIIPDKGYFLDDESLALMDYDAFLSEAASRLDYAKYIDITDTLSLEDYYYTDSHWKQENLLETAEALADALNIHILTDYDQIIALEDFQGVYAGQTAWPSGSDSLNYLYNEQMEDWIVYDYASGREIQVYNLENVDDLDPYDIFLGGSSSLVSIENPNADTDRELVVFRDSYGNSLVPLLASGYSKVWLVDIRNLPASRLGNYIDFTNQDVLFLYSTSILNNSNTLKY